MGRKLASIQRIKNIEPIEGADKIEKLTVLGWHIVASKSENHKIGDLVCYIEVDSQVPEIPMFEFLKDRKYRVRTIKLRKQVSQGLVVPLRELEKNFKIDISKLQEGEDVTKLLGITKYDPQAEAEAKLMEQELQKSKNKVHKYLMKFNMYRKMYCKLFPKQKSGFPSWITKTDETRIQSIPDVFEEIINNSQVRNDYNTFDCTEKIDGQSSTYYIKREKVFGIFSRYEFGVCSRNLRLKTRNNSSYWKMEEKYKIENTLKKLLNKYHANSIVLQGEIVGDKIQGNKYKIEGQKFYAFNLIIDGKKHRTIDMYKILKPYGIVTVPMLMTNIQLKDSIDDMVADSEGKSSLYNTAREGIIWRNLENTISFKVINPKFLLKNGE